ncbi:MAG: hypothetical protein DWQ18_04710 [Crenarchaeota archaeon]|nr:MAG: hypothetical protein DWQ18_04710 [Thermoproteota archaeon]RDJ37782.1 MAG: hypothetical protein DWQ19_04935 [Thermoproteota archaeon]
MFNKNRLKNEENTQKEANSELKPDKIPLKQAMINSFLHRQKATEPLDSKTEEKTSEVSTAEPPIDKISQLIKTIQRHKNRVIAPKIDFFNGLVTYPILSEINESEDNVEFLENLSSQNAQILEKIVYEKIIVCPKHSDSFNINVRLYCKKCSSMDIEKLHLLEHTRCGYISERGKFEHDEKNEIVSCPSCKKPIKDHSKEIRIPAMWYECNNCNEKFDDVMVKLYCRKHDHDFDTSNAATISVNGYKLRDDNYDANSDTIQLQQKLLHVLSKFGFNADENYSIKGTSGRYHHVDIYGKNDSGKSIMIFIKKAEKEIDNSEINSKIIEVLDTSPSIAILIGFATISDKAKSIALSYNVSVIASENPEQIISDTENVIKARLSVLSENEEK